MTQVLHNGLWIDADLAPGSELARSAVYHARKAWNELLFGCGGSGAKFRHRLATWMDEMSATGAFEAQLAAMAMRERIKQLQRDKKSALEWWE